jgi:hypothetical protein
MGLEAQWNNAKLALRDANVDLGSFDLERFNLELESALTAFDDAHENYIGAGKRKSAQQARLLIGVISKAQIVEAIVAEYGSILQNLYGEATDHKQKLGLLVACSHLMKIRQVLSPYVIF